MKWWFGYLFGCKIISNNSTNNDNNSNSTADNNNNQRVFDRADINDDVKTTADAIKMIVRLDRQQQIIITIILRYTSADGAVCFYRYSTFLIPCQSWHILYTYLNVRGVQKIFFSGRGTRIFYAYHNHPCDQIGNYFCFYFFHVFRPQSSFKVTECILMVRTGPLRCNYYSIATCFNTPSYSNALIQTTNIA